jgi:hypothetical protein
MEAIKDGATKQINHSRRETATLWQPRFPSTRSGQAFDVLCIPSPWNLVFLARLDDPLSRPAPALRDGKNAGRGPPPKGRGKKAIKFWLLPQGRAAHRGGVQRKGRVYPLESREGRVGKPGRRNGPAKRDRACTITRAAFNPARRDHAEQAGGGSRVVARRWTDSDMTV